MNKFDIIADGISLDTYDNIGISLNYQIEDILNITKRTTSYSKTITIPGTDTNNKFFKQIFDVNIDNVTFNPKLSIPAIIRIGNQEILSGVMMLLNINVNQRQVDYEVIIFGKIKDIIQAWGDYTLANIDLSEYNHNRSIENIRKSWDYTIKKNGTDVSNFNTGEGYVYPYIIYGNHTDINNRMYGNLMFPAIYLKTIIDKSFQLAGYTYTSEFFNSDYFKSLIIPFTDDKIELSEEDANKRATRIGVEPLPGFTGRGMIPYLKNNTTWYKNYEYGRNYYFPLSKETGQVGDITLQDLENQWFSSSNWINGFTYYQNKNAGFYDVKLNCNFYLAFDNIKSNDDMEYKKGDIKYLGRLVVIRANGSTQVIAQTEQPLSTVPSSGKHPQFWVDYNNPLTLSMAAENIYLGVGDRVVIGFGMEYNGVQWKGFFNDEDIYATAILGVSDGGVPNVIEITPSSNNLQGKNDYINMNQILSTELQIKDLFVSLLKMFNLIVYDNPNKVDDLIIEPRNDFYNSRKKVKDWTYLLDYNNEIKITPMNDMDFRTLSYSYKEDGDYLNEAYTNETKLIYGSYEIDIINDFSEVENKNEILFSPTPNGNLNIGDRVAPYFCDYTDNKLQPKKVKPRILFYKGLKSTSDTIKILDYVGQPEKEGVDIKVYPYVGMWDDPKNPQYDLAFGLTEKVYFPTNVYPLNNLIEQFHKDSILELIDINSKMLEASFYLTTKDISEFDFRDIILIDNAYWRVYKIKDYNPVGDEKVTECVLYKINDVNLFVDGTNNVSFSNRICPTDMVLTLTQFGSFYTSKSGQIITTGCCESIGGKWINGRCYAWSILDNKATTNSSPTPSNNPLIKGGIYLAPSPSKTTEKENQDATTINSPGVMVQGLNNYIGQNVGSSIILGNNSSITDNNSNMIIIGGSISPPVDNSITINTIRLTQDGLQPLITYITDGGYNNVMNVGKTNLIDIIDGGYNSVRNYGGDSKSRPIIDFSINYVLPEGWLNPNKWILDTGFWNDSNIWIDDAYWIDGNNFQP